MADLNQSVDAGASPRARILLVDDDRYLTDALGAQLEGHFFAVQTANSTRQGIIELATDSFDAAIVDWLLPDGEGAALLAFAKRHFPEMPIIVYSAHKEADGKSVVAHADDFVLKGESEEQLFNTLNRVLQAAKASKEACCFAQECRQQRLVHLLKPLRDMLKLPERLSDRVGFLTGGFWDADGLQRLVAATDAMEGEGAIALIDCARVATEAMERQLFGHVELKRTGSPTLERGIFERIGGGRVILINADRLTTSQQERVSQCFQHGRIRRSGSERDIPIRARLAVFVEESKGLDELRKRVSPELTSLIEPDWYDPVRQWSVDGHRVAGLVERMLGEVVGPETRLGAGARWLLTTRFEDVSLGELTGAMARTSFRLAKTPEVEIEDLALPCHSSFLHEADSAAIKSLSDATDTFEKLYMVRVLSETKGNVSKAVKIAGIGRPAFYARLRKHSIAPSAFKPAGPQADSDTPTLL